MESESVMNNLKKSKWIECESKSRPGKKYLFNKSTGECKWINKEKANKTLPSPANERLKRLQKELQKAKPLSTKNDEKETSNSKTKKAPPKFKKTHQTSSLALVSPNDRLKILQGKSIKEHVNQKTQECLEFTSPEKNTYEKIVEAEKTSKNKATKRSAPECKKTREIEIVKKKLSLNIEQKYLKTSPITPISCPVPRYINDFPDVTNTSASSGIDNIKSDSENIAKKQLLQLYSAPTPAVAAETEVQLKFLTETPNNRLLTIKRPKFSANLRLERFRKSLQNENHKVDKNLHTAEDNFGNSKFESLEPMDWEPTDEPNQRSLEFDSSASFNQTASEEPEDMEVDENLMLVAAGEIKEIDKLKEKWQKNRIYIVLDTNIFIKHLLFVDKLKSKKIKGLPEIILYIPYSVLQELDKLKVRENIKGSVIRAIRYLNNMFEEKNEIIQAQNAFEECRHLIDVESPDDSILNCCLQVQAHISNVTLLTEDVNLRNKAMCNNISVSTILELLDKKPSFIVDEKSS